MKNTTDIFFDQNPEECKYVICYGKKEVVIVPLEGVMDTVPGHPYKFLFEPNKNNPEIYFKINKDKFE